MGIVGSSPASDRIRRSGRPRLTTAYDAAIETGWTPERFFEGDPEGLAIERAVEAAVRRLGPVEVRTTKSQVAFRRRRGFAYVWRPSLYLRAATVPAVLSVALPRPLASPRFKEVVNPAKGVWMHHLEVRAASAIDGEVVEWLRQAYSEAGQ